MMIRDFSYTDGRDHELIETLKSGDHLIVLFYASWCPFCTRFLPIFKKHARGKGLNFAMVRDDQGELTDQYSLKIYPTVLFFNRGIVSNRLDGVPGAGLDEKQLAEFLGLCEVP